MTEQVQERPDPSVPITVAPRIRCILAPNASPMTYWGTNTYLVGDGSDAAVIDPGPWDETHLEAILEAVGAQTVSAILVTHAHRDHSALAPTLSSRTGAPVLAFGSPNAGRSDAMQRLAERGLISGGEGVDSTFAPDRTIADGEDVSGDGWSLRAHWTPGHFAGHLAFEVGDVVLTGDLVMGWASTIISPPDGDAGAFLASCARLEALGARLMLPGHGAPVTAPSERIAWLVSNRRNREQAILTALAAGPQTITEIATSVYLDVQPSLIPAAERNVLAHLIDLVEREVVGVSPEIGSSAIYRLAD